MGNLDNAMQDLSRAIQQSPSSETLTNRGVVHCFLGDIPNAMRDYQRALTFDPNYSLAHFNIGNIHFSQHRFRDAVRSEFRIKPHSLIKICLSGAMGVPWVVVMTTWSW